MSKPITLLKVKQKLFPENSKTNVVLSFTVPQELKRLHIAFSYDPKRLEDEEISKRYIEEAIARYSPQEYQSPSFDWREYPSLNNLVTVSLDCCGEYRGCGHRQSPDQKITIEKDRATEGFYKGPIPAGNWRVVLSVHAVVTPVCRYRLKVTGEK